MSYSFAYNNGSSPSGTTKFAKLQIGGNNREYTTYGSLNWYASAPYNGKFLIVSDTYSQGWTTEGNATPTFWRSANNSLDSLKDLVNQLPDVNGVTGFTTPETAINYINSTDKYLISQESDSYNEDDIVLSGLVLNLDAGYSNSYPKSGTTWYDIKGTNNGTLINGPTFSGGGVVFDGVDDYVESASNTNITGASPRTLSVWGYQTTQVSNIFYSICRIGIGSDRQLFEILLYNNLVFGHFWGGGQAISANSNKNLLNTYTNITLTYDGTTAYIYVDGILKNQSNFSLITGNAKLILGRRAYSPHSDYIGRIFNTMLYNRALTASEVLQNYNAQKGRFGL